MQGPAFVIVLVISPRSNHLLQRLPPPGVRPALGHNRSPSASGLLRANSNRSNASSAGTSPRPTSPAKPTATPQASTTPITTRINRANQPSPTKRISTLSVQPRKSLSLRSPGDTPSSPILASPSPAARNLHTQSFAASFTTPTHKRTQSPVSIQPSILPPRQSSPFLPPLTTPSQTLSPLVATSPQPPSPLQVFQVK